MPALPQAHSGCWPSQLGCWSGDVRPKRQRPSFRRRLWCQRAALQNARWHTKSLQSCWQNALSPPVLSMPCQVTELLQSSASLNSSPAEMKPAIAALLAESPAVAAGEATLSGRFDGTWEASTARCLAAPSPALPGMLVPRTPTFLHCLQRLHPPVLARTLAGVPRSPPREPGRRARRALRADPL